MNLSKKSIAVAVLAFSLIGGGSALAAPFSAGALVDSTGEFMTSLSTYAGAGTFDEVNGAATAASFRTPSGVLAQADGSVIVTDARNQVVRKIADGKVTNLVGPELALKLDKNGFPVGGLLDGQGPAVLFNQPAGIAADADGNLYVADAGNNAIRKITKDGTVTTVAGNGVPGLADGVGAAARFHDPKDVAVAADGTVYVADTLNQVIRKIAKDGTVTTLNAPSTRVVEATPGQVLPAGDFRDGDLKQALFNEPSGLAIDSKGNLYVSDSGNQRIRYIDLAAGTVTTVAGGGMAADGQSVYEKNQLYVAGDFADGAASAARFDSPQGLALTNEGGLLIADSQNHSIRYLLNGNVTTLAGRSDQFNDSKDGIEGFGGLQRPVDVAVTANGQVLVADSYNNKVRLVSFFALPSGMPESDSPKVTYAGQWITFDAQPQIVNDRLMVPVRAIAEALGYKVEFQPEGSVIRLTKDGSPTVAMAIGSTVVTQQVAGKDPVQLTMDASPFIAEDRTYVPVRFFAEEIGLDVQWDNTTRTAILRDKVVSK